MIDRACISLGERCNLNCNYCHFKGRLSGKPEEFNNQELALIIDNLFSYCTINHLQQFKIGIVGAGEPLLAYAKIKALINHVRRSRYEHFTFYTITNGTLINDEMIRFFYKNRDLITVCFSLDGYEEMHNIGREKYIKVYQGIKKYEAAFKKMPSLNCTVHKGTIQNADAVRTFFANECFTDVTFSRLVDSDNQNLCVTGFEYTNFIKSCSDFPFSVRQLKPGNEKKYDCTIYGRLCGVGKTNIFITKLGIYPCGRFYGNEKYNFGPFSANLMGIERKMLEMEILDDGECYYDRYVRGSK